MAVFQKLLADMSRAAGRGRPVSRLTAGLTDTILKVLTM